MLKERSNTIADSKHGLQQRRYKEFKQSQSFCANHCCAKRSQ